MVITAIKQQVKLQGRYSVFVDEKYAFSLSDSALLEQKLYNGMELTGEQVADYKRLSTEDKAYGLTLAYVARRIRSEWELQDYFKRKGYADELGQQITERLRSFGMVDDLKFARAWVDNRRILKPISKRRLIQELRQKRISDQIINAVLEEDETDELETLRQLVIKRQRQTKYQDTTKLMQYLARQGFSYDDIKQALQEVAIDE